MTVDGGVGTYLDATNLKNENSAHPITAKIRRFSHTMPGGQMLSIILETSFWHSSLMVAVVERSMANAIREMRMEVVTSQLFCNATSGSG